MHPLHGTWIANLSKSTRHANHQFQSATMRFEVGTDTVVLSYEGINASGKHESSTQTIHTDGQERPVREPRELSQAVRSSRVASSRRLARTGSHSGAARMKSTKRAGPSRPL